MQPFFCIIEISGGLIASYVLDGIAKNRQDHFAAPKAAENPLGAEDQGQRRLPLLKVCSSLSSLCETQRSKVDLRDVARPGSMGQTDFWVLPFLSALACSERYARGQSKRHQKPPEWAWQLLLLVRRWSPDR